MKVSSSSKPRFGELHALPIAGGVDLASYSCIGNTRLAITWQLRGKVSHPLTASTLVVIESRLASDNLGSVPVVFAELSSQNQDLSTTPKSKI